MNTVYAMMRDPSWGVACPPVHDKGVSAVFGKDVLVYAKKNDQTMWFGECKELDRFIDDRSYPFDLVSRDLKFYCEGATLTKLYKMYREAINEYMPKRNGEQYTDEELGEWSKIYDNIKTNYWGRNSIETIVPCLSLMIGEPFDCQKLFGADWRDWAVVVAPVRILENPKFIRRLQIEWFNRGQVWYLSEIKDIKTPAKNLNPDYFNPKLGEFYAHEKDPELIQAEIAESLGYTSETLRVVLYFDNGVLY